VKIAKVEKWGIFSESGVYLVKTGENDFISFQTIND
jgi:hypothetical protein